MEHSFCVYHRDRIALNDLPNTPVRALLRFKQTVLFIQTYRHLLKGLKRFDLSVGKGRGGFLGNAAVFS